MRKRQSEAYRRVSTTFLLLLLLTAGGALHADSLDGLLSESISVRERLPLGGFGLLTLNGCCVELLPKDRWSIEAAWVLSETFVRTPLFSDYLVDRQHTDRISLAELRGFQDDQPGLYVVDGEYLGLELTVRRGLTPGLELSATLPVVSLSGGAGSYLSQWVDESLGVHRRGHEQLPRDSFVLYFRRPDGEEIYLMETPGQGIGDLRLALQGRLPIARHGWTAILGAVVELPTGDPRRLHGSGSVDLGLQLAWARMLGRRRLLGHLGATRLGRHTFLETPAATALSGSLGYQLPLGRRWRATLSWHTAESVIQDPSLRNISRTSSYLDLELVRRGANGTSWHIALCDNLPFDEVPLSRPGGHADFTLQIGARRMLGR